MAHTADSGQPSLQPLMSRRERIQAFLRPLFERLSIPLLSRPGLPGLDREIARRLPERNGWFVEAGANDGFRQSNTYYLARFRGWRGVLIEPLAHLADECRIRRPESQVFQCALGAPENSSDSLQLRYAGLMSSVCGSFKGELDEEKRSKEGQLIQGIPVQTTIFSVPVRTLTDVLDESHTPKEFDLLSLDVEGYELEVLKGLNFEKYRPKALCIEVRNKHLDEVRDILTPHYPMMTPLRRSDHHADYWMVRAIA
jgi:FkbM family methyltransferase